jgi:hypothetical protein
MIKIAIYLKGVYLRKKESFIVFLLSLIFLDYLMYGLIGQWFAKTISYFLLNLFYWAFLVFISRPLSDLKRKILNLKNKSISHMYTKLVNKNAIKPPKGVSPRPTPSFHNTYVPFLPKFGKNLMNPPPRFSNMDNLLNCFYSV